MIDHIGIGVSNLEKSKNFYTKVLSILGYKIMYDSEYVVSFIDSNSTNPSGEFWIGIGKPCTIHLSFSATHKKQVDLFYQKAIESGGIDNGKPGFRPHYHEKYYAAFVLDPDGNNIEAVCHN